MKTFFSILLLLSVHLSINAQIASEWLQLTPLKVENPVLKDIKNVDNKTFSPEMFLQFSNINITELTPIEDITEKNFQALKWHKANLDADTVIFDNNDSLFHIIYNAVYVQTEEWVKGDFKFKFFGPTEVYLNEKKVLSHNTDKSGEKSFNHELTPGKHLLIVKSVTRGGKLFSARFSASLPKDIADITFSTSPLRGKNIYDILNGHRSGNLSLSHDGNYAIITDVTVSNGKNSSITHIYHTNNKKIVYSFLDNSASPRWVPGKNQISYMRKEGNGQSLYIYDIEQQENTCIIKEDQDIKYYNWSPDLSYIIYSKSEDFSEKNWELRKLDGIEDRQGYYRNRSWLYKYDITSGLHSRLTWGKLSTNLHSIHPNGEQIIFSTTYNDYEEFPFRKQTVYLLDVNTMELDTLWSDLLFGMSCSYSPDGKKLLIKGGASVFGKLGENIGKNQIPNQYDTQLYIYDIESKKVEAITKNFNPSVNSTFWHKNGNIYLSVTEADFSPMYIYNTKSKQFSKIDCPGDMIGSFSIAKDGNTMMYSASDASAPAKIYTLNLSTLSTDVWSAPSAKDYENIVMGEIKEWDYNYKKGTVIDGRYYLPADFDPNKKYPLIVYYYGGTTPVGRTFGGRYPFNLFAANGYIVYVLQPSGAIGYGQEFSARHQNNWCKITGDEIINATKAFIKAHPFVDASKVGCMGASYGGFTTMYLTTQTDIFTCAISHAGISSISSYWGFGYWGYSYNTNAAGKSYPWNRKDIFVDQSPLFNADKANTPILLLHGTKDVNVPFAESMQFYTALKLLGKEAELVMIKDTDHHVVTYKQRILWHNSIMAWFEKHLKNKPQWWENIYKEKNL